MRNSTVFRHYPSLNWFSHDLQVSFELNPDVVDYVIFRPHKYKTNMATQKSGVSGIPTGAPVTLYMPTTTPTLDNNNKWGESTLVLWEGS